jgi:UDP-N-acetylmuramyl pentapeptide phosphotransferase/UDP-N-acetylglucosamine-1-phosphate transferase
LIGSLLGGLAACLLSVLLIRRFLDPDSPLHVLDRPNHRSMHRHPIPRSGGVAVIGVSLALGAVGFWLGAASAFWLWVGAGVLLLALVGFRDDLDHVGVGYRLLAQGLAALLLLGGLTALPDYALAAAAVPSWLLQAGLLLAVVWMTNLYNFMDGMDGLAGGMSLVGFSTLLLVGWQDPYFALVCALVAGAVSGFLLFNLPPARIFLGDVGSAPLGYLVAALSVYGVFRELFPAWLPVLVFSPFIFDASYTLIRRLLAGKPVWQAHREHLYQRMVQAGWGQRKTLSYLLVLMLCCAFSAVQGAQAAPRDQGLLLSAWAVIYLLLAYRVRLLERVASSSGTGR